MISQIISNYLATHRRLVVPQLGTFIVKEADGTILFSELLRRDDGVLRGLLVAEGLNDLEAAGRIDRFVFEIRHSVQNGTPCPIEGLGVMRPGANGTIAFEQHTAQPAHPSVHTAPHHTATGIRTPKISVSPKLKPEPYVKGLRYGSPQKDSRHYAYASGSGRRVDKILVVAIVAAIIAVAAIAFGYVRKSRDAAAEAAEMEQEQIGWISPEAPQNTPQP